MSALVYKIMRRLSRLNRKNSYSSTYYQKLHENSEHYQNNNWLLEHSTKLKNFNDSILEIGCGNGDFLVEAASFCTKVTGLDWAKSPDLPDLPANASFVEGDATKFDFSKEHYELICSADVLEHFPNAALDLLIPRLIASAKYNFHIIACYDDGHSHITVNEPEWWLEQFQKHQPEFKLSDRWLRPGKKKNECCIISNL